MMTAFDAADKNKEALTAMGKFLTNIPGISFNCLYSVLDPTNAGTADQFSISNIGWNVLYNLGYMYSDLKGIYDIF